MDCKGLFDTEIRLSNGNEGELKFPLDSKLKVSTSDTAKFHI